MAPAPLAWRILVTAAAVACWVIALASLLRPVSIAVGVALLVVLVEAGRRGLWAPWRLRRWSRRR